MSTQYAGGPILSIPVTSGGVSFTSAPTVVLAGTGAGFGATFTANFSGGSVTSITVNTGGHLYPISGVTASVTGGGGSGCVLGAPVVSGGDVNTTYTSDGTKQNLINAIETALLAAAWTTVSGHATTNLLMQTHSTPYPLQANFRFRDNGGTSIQITVENTSGSVAGPGGTGNGVSLTPVNTRVFRVIANPYQFFILVPGTYNAACTFAFGGVPYVPSFVTGVTAAGLVMGNSESDGDTSTRLSWRTNLTPVTSNFTIGLFQTLWNASLFNGTNTAPGSAPACPCLLVPMMANLAAIGTTTATWNQPYRWAGLQIHSGDPLICWGLTGYSDEPQIRGQLWDALVVCDAYTGDSTSSWDSHNWFAITNNNTGLAGNGARGTLFVVTP